MGGAGAHQKAQFYFTNGTVLNVVVGANGTTQTASGGAGASWVWVCSGASRPTHPVLVAGGGGGSGSYSAGLNASFTTTTGIPTGGYGGGASGSSYGAGAGGVGWRSNGGAVNSSAGNCYSTYAANGGYISGSSINGGAGNGSSQGGAGGGGGGGMWRNYSSNNYGGGGGGGGGYYGGKGGNGQGNCSGGSGGGSYISSNYGYVGGSAQGYSCSSSYAFVSITLTCYLPGTLILTTLGEVAVENLKPGDLLPTLSGEKVPIKWVGIQQFMGKNATKDTSPVRFHAGSLGNGLPKRDLYVSAGHSMKIGDHLVDARLLVNGVTITQRQRVEQLDYYHIDLGEHHCILAEGVWSESYLECNANRETFVNAGEFYDTHRYHLTNSLVEKCLPHVADYQDPRHPALFKTLLAHIPANRITTDPDLHLLADGKRLEPYEFVPQSFVFRIPSSTQVLRLKSRTSRPSELGLPADDRQLGFCLESLSAESEEGTVKISIEPHHSKLLQGFHRAEGTQHRWTQGDAVLPKMLLGDGTEEINLTIKGRALPRYHLSDVDVLENQTTS